MRVFQYVRAVRTVYPLRNGVSYTPRYLLGRVTDLHGLQAWDSNLKQWVDGRGLLHTERSCLLELSLMGCDGLLQS